MKGPAMRTTLIAFLAAAFASPAALADGHATSDSHSQPAPMHTATTQGCCLSVEGDTVQVLVAPSREALRRVQAELAVLGFDPGHIDGIMGPRTEGALRAFQRQRGLVEGLLTTETMTALGISVRRPAAMSHSGLMGSGHATITHHASTCCTPTRTVTRRHVTRVERHPATRTSTQTQRAPAPRTLNYIGRAGTNSVEPLQWWEKSER